MQRLGQALANGNLNQARFEFEALVSDAPEIGQADPMAHPQFVLLGRAIQSLDLAAASEAFSQLQNQAPSLRQRQTHPDEHQGQDSTESQASDADAPGQLDVTA